VTQRLAIVSDIHGNLVALEAVIADIEAHSPDLIVHGGDLAVIGPRPAELIDRIHDLGWPGVLATINGSLYESRGAAVAMEDQSQSVSRSGLSCWLRRAARKGFWWPSGWPLSLLGSHWFRDRRSCEDCTGRSPRR